MSFDKQNFARTMQEQQAGIAPQMWPIKLDLAQLSLNSPFEVDINPCDCIWLPNTYDKSYGVNPLQQQSDASGYFSPSSICGQNVVDIWIEANFVANVAVYTIQAPVFALRFNSPNNPWLLWGLGGPTQIFGWGDSTSPPPAIGGTQPFGYMETMRSITGPISRLWCQFYSPTLFNGEQQDTQVMLMSMLGFSMTSAMQGFPIYDGQSKRATVPPINYAGANHCGGYRTTDLNSADLRVLGVNPVAVAPTPAGAGSTKG